MCFDSLQDAAILSATNLLYQDKYYPLGNIGKIENLKTVIQIDTSFSGRYFAPLFKIIDTVEVSFLDSKLFADTLILTPDKQYIYGGELYTKHEKFDFEKKGSIYYFYIAFRIKADLLFVWEDRENHLTMKNWSCQDTYKYTNESASPTSFLLNLISERPLKKQEIKKLNLTKLKKFGYNFYFCE